MGFAGNDEKIAVSSDYALYELRPFFGITREQLLVLQILLVDDGMRKVL